MSPSPNQYVCAERVQRGSVTIGITTLTVMGIGMALVRFTRYQLAGTGMTWLATLAMPLNLWFYAAQGLITIVDGGHLWIPAAICCGIYAFIARVLRAPLFAYTVVGGVVPTGMLFLADQTVGHFWELWPPATFLTFTGWIASTTVNGVGLLTVYILSVLALVQWPSQLQSMSVVMMAGGGLIFVTAVLLSRYRDRLVSFRTFERHAAWFVYCIGDSR